MCWHVIQSWSVEQAVQAKHRQNRHFFSVGKKSATWSTVMDMLLMPSFTMWHVEVYICTATKKRIFEAGFYTADIVCMARKGGPENLRCDIRDLSLDSSCQAPTCGSYILCYTILVCTVFVTMWQPSYTHSCGRSSQNIWPHTSALIWITHCIFDIVKEHNISMTFFANKRGVVQIWGSQDSHKALKNVC